MDAEHPRQVVTRLYRAGEQPASDADWTDLTPDQRIDAVWMLTLTCLAWNQEDFVEPRLQRSVVRVQRQRR